MRREFDKEINPAELKMLSYQDAIVKIRECRERGLRVVLAQGVFDIVHVGHIEYFRSSQKRGDLLFVGVENDEAVRLNKGGNRPFNSLGERLEFLSELESVDFVFGFETTPNYGRDLNLYIRRYRELNPTAVAVSSWDLNLEMKKLQANAVGIELLLIDHARRDSSTRLLQMIGYE